MDSERVLTPRDALGILKEGNRHFISGAPERPRQDYQRIRDVSRQGQQPFAAILSCSDSRLPLEIMFDCGFGDLFAIRTAGNTFTPAALGAVEFAAGILAVPLLVVMGHTDCGAVGAVVDGAKVPPSMAPALATIKEAASRGSMAPSADRATSVAIANVWLTIERLIQRSAVLPTRLQSGQMGIAAALCTTASAKVSWLDRPPG